MQVNGTAEPAREAGFAIILELGRKKPTAQKKSGLRFSEGLTIDGSTSRGDMI